MRKRKLILSLLVALLMPLFTLLPMRSVYAHAEYDHSEPAADAVVEAAPTQVRIWFTQELFRRKGVNSIEVESPDGVRVDQNDLSIDDDDRTLAMVSLSPTLSAGAYTVHWSSTSAEDGHEGKGEFTFTIASSETVTETATTSTPDKTLAATATSEPQPTATDTPAAAATAVPPTVAAVATPAGGGSALPCLGGAMPLVVVLGAVLAGRRRSK